MSIVADLHLHSKYSRAVSPKMDLFEIARWGSKKGINLAATGDFLHPLWLRHLRAELKEVADGIFTLKNPSGENKNPVNFMLSVEVANIFSQNGLLRRVHNLLFVPSLEACEKMIKALEARGAKLMSDGRPILGIPQKDFLQIALSVSEDCLLIPAHAWTPWFGQYGSKSGFNSLEEAYGDLTEYIYGIETGLSSDPIMNWQIKELETRSILSFSDAHSGPKMGREATVFVPTKTENNELRSTNYNYKDIADAIKRRSDAKYKIGFTVEFFPEEGKYHYTGHRSCGIKYSVRETLEKGATCPVCRAPLTVGVEHRVYDLSHRAPEEHDIEKKQSRVGTTFIYDKERSRPPFVSLIPLMEILTELEGGSPIRAIREFDRLTETIGTEFEILLKKSYEELEKGGGNKFMEAVKKVRERNILIDPGYDGVFGVVSIFGKKEGQKETVKQEEAIQDGQASLF